MNFSGNMGQFGHTNNVLSQFTTTCYHESHHRKYYNDQIYSTRSIIKITANHSLDPDIYQLCNMLNYLYDTIDLSKHQKIIKQRYIDEFDADLKSLETMLSTLYGTINSNR